MGKIAKTTAYRKQSSQFSPESRWDSARTPVLHLMSVSPKRNPVSLYRITGSFIELVSLFECFAQGSNFAIHRSRSKCRPERDPVSFPLLHPAPRPHLGENTLHVNKLLSKTPQPWHFFLPFPNLLPFKTPRVLPCSHRGPIIRIIINRFSLFRIKQCPSNEAKNSQCDPLKQGVSFSYTLGRLPPETIRHRAARNGQDNIESRTVNGCQSTDQSAPSMSVKTNRRQKHQNAGWSFDIPAGSECLASKFLKSISPFCSWTLFCLMSRTNVGLIELWLK